MRFCTPPRAASLALPLDKAIRYAIEIADALSRAHRQGIIHRWPHILPGPKLTTSAPRVLFQELFESDHRGDTNYDVSSDDQHFILIKSERQVTRFNVVMNWFNDIRSRF